MQDFQSISQSTCLIMWSVRDTIELKTMPEFNQWINFSIVNQTNVYNIVINSAVTNHDTFNCAQWGSPKETKVPLGRDNCVPGNNSRDHSGALIVKTFWEGQTKHTMSFLKVYRWVIKLNHCIKFNHKLYWSCVIRKSLIWQFEMVYFAFFIGGLLWLS